MVAKSPPLVSVLHWKSKFLCTELSRRLVSFTTLAGLVERLNLVISFASKGFPYKGHIKDWFIVMVYCMYSQNVTFSTFPLVSLLNVTCFSKARYSLFVLKVPLNPNKSILSVLYSCCRVRIKMFAVDRRTEYCWIYWVTSQKKDKN